MTNKEKAIEIFRLLEENHKNLYHDISKKDFQEKLNKFLKKADQYSQLEFDCEMLKIFAVFKDAHTKYLIPKEYLDKKLVYIEDKVIVKDNNEFKEVLSIGNMPIKEVLEKIAEMQCYETEAWLNYLLNDEINNEVYYEMLGIARSDHNGLDCVVNNNGKEENLTINSISHEKFKELGYFNDSPFYSYEMLDDNVLKIKYRLCKEHKDYPFKDFVEKVKQEIESKEIKQYILDLRGNTGGNSLIVRPLIELIKDKGLDGVVLIDNGVFSSGRFAVANFKEEFNSPLIGEPTGGAIKSYGHCKDLEVEDVKFSASMRFWDFSWVFGDGEGCINPDIHVPKTIEDMKENKDSQLLTALDYLTIKKYFDRLTTKGHSIEEIEEQLIKIKDKVLQGIGPKNPELEVVYNALANDKINIDSFFKDLKNQQVISFEN